MTPPTPYSWMMTMAMTQSIDTPAWADEMLDQLADGKWSFRMDQVGLLARTPMVEQRCVSCSGPCSRS